MIFSATLRRTGCGLLGHVDDAHAPLADLLHEPVGADRGADAFRGRSEVDGGTRVVFQGIEEAAGLGMAPEQDLDPAAQRVVPGTGFGKILRPLVRLVPPHGIQEDHLGPGRFDAHDSSLGWPSNPPDCNAKSEGGMSTSRGIFFRSPRSHHPRGGER